MSDTEQYPQEPMDFVIRGMHLVEQKPLWFWTGNDWTKTLAGAKVFAFRESAEEEKERTRNWGQYIGLRTVVSLEEAKRP